LAAKANRICATHSKKTIVAEHVFEAMHESKQTQLLGPILDTPNYAKLSYTKQKEIAIKKVNELEQLKSKKLLSHEMNTMTTEEQI
jgi:hypothetical protein